MGILLNPEIAPDDCACVLTAASSESGKLREMSQNWLAGGLVPPIILIMDKDSF